MKENKLTIIINRPVEAVFEFTTNPINTHVWIESIQEEIVEKYPPEIDTIYKNTSNGVDWDVYKVVEFLPNKIFTLSDSESNYHVRYSYTVLDFQVTELEYFEWMENGELTNPFKQEVLEKLKSVLEQ